ATPMTYTEYDQAGNALRSWDPLGYVSEKVYDRTNRVVLAIDPMGHSTSTTYDLNGNATQVFSPRGYQSHYASWCTQNTYDIHNRLTDSVDALGINNHFEYNDAGDRTLLRDGMHQSTTFAYDYLHRVTYQHASNWTILDTYNAIRKVAHNDGGREIL